MQAFYGIQEDSKVPKLASVHVMSNWETMYTEVCAGLSLISDSLGLRYIKQI